MDTYQLVRKCVAGGIIFLFVSTGIIPSTAQNMRNHLYQRIAVNGYMSVGVDKGTIPLFKVQLILLILVIQFLFLMEHTLKIF